MLCNWVINQGATAVHSFADLKSLVAEWDGTEPPLTTWNNVRLDLEHRAAAILQDRRERESRVEAEMRQQQIEAARLRLIDELGRMLICYEPTTDDLNGKLYRLASELTPTATRLRRVLERLGGYPDWAVRQSAELRDFRARLNGFQLKARLTGRELDAALDDPRWSFAKAS
jgi:hypothetical protein